jgi:hypothetical protein
MALQLWKMRFAPFNCAVCTGVNHLKRSLGVLRKHSPTLLLCLTLLAGQMP